MCNETYVAGVEQELKETQKALNDERQKTTRLTARSTPKQKATEERVWRQVRVAVMKYHPDKAPHSYPDVKTMADELAKTVNGLVEASRSS